MEETLENRGSLAAPLIFIFIVFLQLVPVLVRHMKKRGSYNAEEIKLQQEIKELLKEVAALSNPSTFAQAAKLRRTAAAKEKQLRESQELHKKESQSPYDICLKVLLILKVISYPLLIVWFWSYPVAVVSQELLQPFANVISWRAQDSANSHIMVGIIPWLVISSRVSKFICHKITK